MDGLVPLSVRGDVKKKSRQNFSGGGGGNQPRTDPVKDQSQFQYTPKLDIAHAATPRVPDTVKPPELPSDMVLTNKEEVKQHRGDMPDLNVRKAYQSLIQFSKDLHSGKI